MQITKPLWQEASPAQNASAGEVHTGRCLLVCVHCLGSPDFACDVGLLGQAGQADRRDASLSLYPQEVLVLRNGHLIVLLVMVLAG